MGYLFSARTVTISGSYVKAFPLIFLTASVLIEPYRALALYDKLVKKTWVIFWWQIGTFGVGISLLVLGIAASVSEKLL